MATLCSECGSGGPSLQSISKSLVDPGEIFFIDSRRFLSLTRPQVLLTTPLTIIAVSLAFYAVRSEGGETTWDAQKVRIAYSMLFKL